MVRDKFKDKGYFDDFISSLSESQQRRINKLETNKIKEDRVSKVKKEMSKNYFRLINARYSRGDEIFSKEVYLDLNKAITLLNESWYENHSGIIQSKENTNVYLKQYSYSTYSFLLNLLSLSVLLDLQFSQCRPLINFIDRDGVIDFLFEFLMSYIQSDRTPKESESYEEFFGINERVGRLKSLINLADKNIAEQELKFYLENEWYISHKDTPMFNQHKNPHNTYSGYWCFIAAAIVKIKNLNDVGFRDNTYYPQDLVSI